MTRKTALTPVPIGRLVTVKVVVAAEGDVAVINVEPLIRVQANEPSPPEAVTLAVVAKVRVAGELEAGLLVKVRLTFVVETVREDHTVTQAPLMRRLTLEMLTQAPPERRLTAAMSTKEPEDLRLKAIGHQAHRSPSAAAAPGSPDCTNVRGMRTQDALFAAS